MSGKRGTFAFNLNIHRPEDAIGFDAEYVVELKPGEVLQEGDFRFSKAFGWVLVEPNLFGKKIPKVWIKLKKRGSGYLRPKKNIK